MRILTGPSAAFIYNYHEHDSLLANIEAEKLLPEECEVAWQEFLQERSTPASTMAAEQKPSDIVIKASSTSESNVQQLILVRDPQVVAKTVHANGYLVRREYSNAAKVLVGSYVKNRIAKFIGSIEKWQDYFFCGYTMYYMFYNFSVIVLEYILK